MSAFMAMVMSVEWLAAFGDPRTPMQIDAVRGEVVVVSGEGDDLQLKWHDASTLPSATLLSIVAQSDTKVREALDAASYCYGMLHDAGDPARLWALAHELGLLYWMDDESMPETRVRVAVRIARCAGAAHPAADTPTLCVLRAAARIALGEGDGAQLRELAAAAGFGPHLLLRPDGFPVGLGGGMGQGLPGDAAKIFRKAVDRLRAGTPLAAAPVMGPVLSGVPEWGDPQDAQEVGRYAALAGDVARVPAPDPIAVRTQLLQRFPWMDEAAGAVARELALLPPGTPCVLPPVLLLGPPGCGKSSFARELASACGLPWRLVHTADGNGATTLSGNGRGWRSGRPALPLTVMLDEGVSTVAVVVDDVDRQGTDTRFGTPQEFLLGLTEPSTAKAFWDPYLLVRCDLSTVSWMMTANDIAAVAGALLDRVGVIEVGYPPPEAAEGVLASVIRDVEADAGWEPGSLRLPTSTRDLLLAHFASDPSTLRLLRRAVRAALGAGRLGEDDLSAARVALFHARGRDDRAYAGSSMMGFGRRPGR